MENIKRNPDRKRQRSGRARTNALNGMTPQGEAIWCAENIENAYNFGEYGFFTKEFKA
jgi:hypothetical protein